jgi:hypothetical protein
MANDSPNFIKHGQSPWHFDYASTGERKDFLVVTETSNECQLEL